MPEMLLGLNRLLTGEQTHIDDVRVALKAAIFAIILARKTDAPFDVTRLGSKADQFTLIADDVLEGVETQAYGGVGVGATWPHPFAVLGMKAERNRRAIVALVGHPPCLDGVAKVIRVAVVAADAVTHASVAKRIVTALHVATTVFDHHHTSGSDPECRAEDHGDQALWKLYVHDRCLDYEFG